MLPLEHPDGIHIAFDDHRLVANAGLILPATLALHLGLPQLVRQRLDLGDAPGRANTGDKVMTVVASALAGGDCIDDADVLRTGGTAGALGCVVKAPSTLGTFRRSFRWGQVRQLDRVSRELLARAWAAGAGPGDGPLTIDLDSTSCEDLWSGQGGCPPPWLHRPAGLSPAAGPGPDSGAGTGDVLMSRLREGHVGHSARITLHLAQLAAQSFDRRELVRVGRPVQGPLQQVGQSPIQLQPCGVDAQPHRAPEQAKGRVGSRRLQCGHLGAEQLPPPRQISHASGQARPGRAQGRRSSHHRREDRAGNRESHRPVDDLPVRDPQSPGAIPKPQAKRAGHLPGLHCPDTGGSCGRPIRADPLSDDPQARGREGGNAGAHQTGVPVLRDHGRGLSGPRGRRRGGGRGYQPRISSE